MLLAHLTVAGVVEFALTVGVIAYLSGPTCRSCGSTTPTCPRPTPMVADPRRLQWRWALSADRGDGACSPRSGCSPPAAPSARTRPGDLDLKKYHLDAVPSGLRHYAGFWHHALFNGYDFSHDRTPSLGYLVSAFFGAIASSSRVLADLVPICRRRPALPRASAARRRVEAGVTP